MCSIEVGRTLLVVQVDILPVLVVSVSSEMRAVATYLMLLTPTCSHALQHRIAAVHVAGKVIIS